jgi:hypothetical protein
MALSIMAWGAAASDLVPEQASRGGEHHVDGLSPFGT